MIKFTPDMLRRLADDIEKNNKYHNKRGYVELTIKEHPSGKQYAEFEQPCIYAECFGTFYRYEDDE